MSGRAAGYPNLVCIHRLCPGYAHGAQVISSEEMPIIAFYSDSCSLVDMHGRFQIIFSVDLDLI